MRWTSRLGWKLAAIVAAILVGAIGISDYAGNAICAHYSLESARAFLSFNSESIIRSIGQLMMSRDNQRIEDLLIEMSQGSRDYGRIQLVAHYSGEVVASRFGTDRTPLTLTERACTACHNQEGFRDADVEILSEVLNRSDGTRVLSVVAPIVNEPRCRNASCHVHAESPPILGLLNTDYSLQRLDAMAADRMMLVTVTGVASALMGSLTVWFMFAWLLERPIRRLTAGTRRIASRQFDFRFHPIRNDEIGALEESFNSMTDALQAHQAELRGARDYLQGIVENSADIIVTVDREELIRTFNRGAELALGYAREEVIGRQIDILFADPRERDTAVAQLADTDHVKNYETRFIAKDGRIRDVLLTLSRLRDPDGNALGTFGISKDVTSEKKLQRQLANSQEFAAIGQTVTGIQHAIRNMLSTLKCGAYLVRDGMTKNNREWLEEGWGMVEEGIELISDLATEMMNYARDWKPNLQRVDLGEMVERICEMNQRAAAKHAVVLRCEVPDELPTVLCDQKLIHMATTDFLVNAIDACAEKDYAAGETPEVVLATSLCEDEGRFVIAVRDNGCGMSAETKRNAFEPFFSTKDNRGTGLGLAMVSRIMRLHGGDTVVESELGRGTLFRLRLPLDGPDEGNH